ncbi:MAG: hypothetical protein HZA24_05845 [Nitrospirae bacterium]|nr:hypothetical protein [Nitrospirota bacterium]
MDFFNPKPGNRGPLFILISSAYAHAIRRHIPVPDAGPLKNAVFQQPATGCIPRRARGESATAGWRGGRFHATLIYVIMHHLAKK